jgi:leader peptidase (prepilin peptidase) / N-methyltransferase
MSYKKSFLPCTMISLFSLLSLILASHFGLSVKLIFALILTWSLVTLAVIDCKTLLLPDQITLPVLWLGLFSNIYDTFASLQSAVLGAIGGYLFFYLLARLVFTIKRIEGLGGGDFKLLAMIGAWLGWELLPVVIFIASTTGVIYGALRCFYQKQSSATPLPFGPFLAFSTIICLLCGHEIMALSSYFP